MKAPDKIYIQTNAGEAISSKWTTIPFRDFENTEYIRSDSLQQEQPHKSFCEENCKGYRDTGGKCFFGFNCSAKKAQEQPEALEVSKFCQPVPKNIANCVAEHYWELLDDEKKEDTTAQQEQPEVNFKIEERKWVYDAVDNIFPEDGDFMSEVDFRKILKDTARHFYELGLNARKEN